MTAAPLCPYCGAAARFMPDSTPIYGADYGPMWVCTPCQAWAGCHKGTDTPLGRLANHELRQAKIRAHNAFDRLWQAKIRREGVSRKAARGAGYRWLAKTLGIDPKLCHIGMFDVADCDRVVEVCKPYHRERKHGRHR